MRRQHAVIHVAREDKDFLWSWARELQERTGVKTAPEHLISAFIEQLRNERSQQGLFGVTSEVETAAIRLASRDLAQADERAAYRKWFRGRRPTLPLGSRKDDIEEQIRLAQKELCRLKLLRAFEEDREQRAAG